MPQVPVTGVSGVLNAYQQQDLANRLAIQSANDTHILQQQEMAKRHADLAEQQNTQNALQAIAARAQQNGPTPLQLNAQGAQVKEQNSNQLQQFASRQLDAARTLAAVNPKLSMEFAKSAADLNTKALQNQKAALETTQKSLGFIGSLLQSAQDQPSYNRSLATAAYNGVPLPRNLTGNFQKDKPVIDQMYQSTITAKERAAAQQSSINSRIQQQRTKEQQRHDMVMEGISKAAEARKRLAAPKVGKTAMPAAIEVSSAKAMLDSDPRFNVEGEFSLPDADRQEAAYAIASQSAKIRKENPEMAADTALQMAYDKVSKRITAGKAETGFSLPIVGQVVGHEKVTPEYSPIIPKEDINQSFNPNSAEGMIKPGNIDIYNRPIAHNSDGSISTVRSITITDDNGKAILIPTVINGKVVSDKDAINHYKKTGENLGIFKNETFADKYAIALHNQQANEYIDRSSKRMTPADIQQSLVNARAAIASGKWTREQVVEKLQSAGIDTSGL